MKRHGNDTCVRTWSGSLPDKSCRDIEQCLSPISTNLDGGAKVQVTGHRLQVTGHRLQVTGHRSQVKKIKFEGYVLKPKMINKTCQLRLAFTSVCLRLAFTPVCLRLAFTLVCLRLAFTLVCLRLAFSCWLGQYSIYLSIVSFIEYCPNQQLKANRKQTKVKANHKQTRVKANRKQTRVKANRKQTGVKASRN